MLVIRNYKSQDFSDVVSVWKSAGIYDENSDTPERLDNHSQRNAGCILVAEFDNKIVGAVIVMETGWYLFIFHLAVAPEFRNKGIGSASLNAAESLARSKGYQEVALFAFEENNEVHEWYMKRGWHKEKNYTCMIKRL